MLRVDQCGRAFDVFVSLRFVCTCLCVFVSSSLGSQALQHHSLFDRLGRIDPVMELNFCNKAPQRRVLYKVSRRRPNSDLATMCPVCPEVLAELHVMTLDKVFKSEDAGKAQTFRKTSQLTQSRQSTAQAMYIPAAGQYNYEYLPPDRRAGVPQTQAKQSTMRRLIHRLSLRALDRRVRLGGFLGWPKAPNSPSVIPCFYGVTSSGSVLRALRQHRIQSLAAPGLHSSTVLLLLLHGRAPGRTEVTATITAVGPGDCLSEYCLWVEGWKHRGLLAKPWRP